MNYRWLYIDLNSFFASVEQQLNPGLRNKPVAVIPVASDATSVIAASYEAKAFGIKTGTAVYEAKKLCPEMTYVIARHRIYIEFHQKVLQEIENHLPVAKVCSIDEFACQVLEDDPSGKKWIELAQNIKQGIASRVGVAIKCSIGIAPNGYLAKVATDMQKPDGLTLISQNDLPAKLFSLKLRDLPGIGPRMEKRLQRYGIFDVKTLCSLDLIALRRAWGNVWGERMWHHLRGINLPDIETRRSSLGHSHVLAPHLRDPYKARLVANRLTIKCASRLRSMGFLACLISLSCKTEDKEYIQEKRKCPEACDTSTFLELVDQMWKKAVGERKEIRIKKVSITLSRLVEQGSSEQLDLFDKRERKTQGKSKKISFALDKINERYGKDSVLIGLLPGDSKNFPEAKIAFQRIPDPTEFIQ